MRLSYWVFISAFPVCGFLNESISLKWKSSLNASVSNLRILPLRPNFGAIPENEFLDNLLQLMGLESPLRNFSNFCFFGDCFLFFYSCFLSWLFRMKFMFFLPWMILYYFSSFLLFEVTVNLWGSCLLTWADTFLYIFLTNYDLFIWFYDASWLLLLFLSSSSEADEYSPFAIPNPYTLFPYLIYLSSPSCTFLMRPPYWCS